MTYIFSDEMPERLYNFALDSLRNMCKDKPKWATLVYEGEDGNIDIAFMNATCMDLQRAATELNNQAIVDMIALNKDYLEEREEYYGAAWQTEEENG